MDSPKIFALYLPQYHAIAENDKWWGEGFTEWTNVKKARPLFKNHNQPRVPLNDNYYNLLDDKTFKWQTDIAKQYGIDGFCIYHYWFNGKLLLEKPAENYLANKDLDFPFFFSWANEPWTRAWDGQKNNILIDQHYGGKEDIERHFDYLLPFFLDKRYYKINNKPIFVIYRANSISYFEEMVKTWNDLAIENGLKGVYFIESLSQFQNDKISASTNACFHFEPMWSNQNNILDGIIMQIKSIISLPIKRPYKKSIKNITKKEKLSSTRFAGFFVDWDNTPRREKDGFVHTNTSVEIFEKYFEKLLIKMAKCDCPFVFINAWNEWGEGAYLEPDTKNNYGFLESIKRCKDKICKSKQ